MGNPWQYDKEKSRVCAVDISPDGWRVATGSKDGKIRVWKWDGRTATMIVESKKHGAAANCVCWSRHDGGAYIASGFDDGSVAVWPSSGLEDPMRTDDTRLRYIHAINYSHDGTQLLVSGYDREISRLTVSEKAWMVKLDEVIKICNNPNHVSSATWATTTDSHAIVTGLKDGKIKIFELSEGRLLELDSEGPGHSDQVCAVVFPDTRVLASVSYDRTLRFWDLGAKRTIGQPLPHSADLTCAAFASNGTLVATSTCDGHVYLWDIADFLSSAILMEAANGRDGDATAGPPFDPKSPIPHRQRASEARPRPLSSPTPNIAPGRKKPVISIPKDFFDGVRPAGVNAPTLSVGRRISISPHFKVAASRIQQIFRSPRTPIKMLPTNAYLGGIQEETQQNLYVDVVAVPITTGRQQSGVTNKPTTQDTIRIRRTPWVNALLLIGCIPVDLSKSMESY